ncbi:hypothetical protein LSS_22950 [Leptospira santarosai serovar Shermani str. LT 821]|uniref:Uncharacterized protein n=1 Tax=Leptospira santarosai serovar Shermani str. LT 821 TaxID=758847 RepID=A0A097ESZ4_9LEPT|nr:hypothetical protein LSS_22950 [Leptospira santarosai serovar Shermani str. LT 821]
MIFLKNVNPLQNFGFYKTELFHKKNLELIV